MNTPRLSFFTALALCLAITSPLTVHGAPITFNFTGILNNAPISGSYTFESTAPLNDVFSQSTGRVALFDQNPPRFDPPWTSAAGSITAATVNWAGTTASLNPALPLPQFTDYGSNGITVYHSGYTDVYGATFRVQGLTGYGWFGLTVVGQGLLEQMALPAVPPSLNGSPAPSARLELFNLGTGAAFVQGTLTSLTAVPIPGAMLLFGSGLAAIMGGRPLRRLIRHHSGLS